MIAIANNAQEWDAFLNAQTYSPFLQSWTMGEVYEQTNQKPIRIEVRSGELITGICQALIVPARRGRHISVPYGPVLQSAADLDAIIEELKKIAHAHNCSFIRMSPFWPKDDALSNHLVAQSKAAPLHLLAEHIWHIDLTGKSEEEILKGMRKNTRNLIRRAQKEGVEITRSENPNEDIVHFLKLHEETRKRHKFTPYTDAFFRAQVAEFAARNECSLYLAHYQGEVIASSVHMHMGGETSYHHGASTHKFSKIPASYLLQWTAICDTIARGDHLYNFWGIAPEDAKNHPFAGVTTFKTGFGGEMLELMHCRDILVKKNYYLTRMFEVCRKWKRGF